MRSECVRMRGHAQEQGKDGVDQGVFAEEASKLPRAGDIGNMTQAGPLKEPCFNRPQRQCLLAAVNAL